MNINNIKFDFNTPDKFDNKLIERFIIINIPEQDISNLLQLPKKEIHDNFKDKKIIDSKYLIFINDKHEKNYQIFIKKNIKIKKNILQ